MNDRAKYLHTFMHQYPNLYACAHCQPLLTLGEKSFFFQHESPLSSIAGTSQGS